MPSVTDGVGSSFLQKQTKILCDSYRHWTGLCLVDDLGDISRTVKNLFEAPYAVASHDTQADPIFNYANQQAQQLFGMSWDEIIGLPSRYSAEPMNREERALLLGRVSRHGYVDDYTGIRIAKDGRRFMIRNATVWNLLDVTGAYCGQAALIRDWVAL
ncbi:MAG TPA: MEKHLA domain-containing protein [Methylophilaceae bacterium]|jgi:PAS domain S-box-containing protein